MIHKKMISILKCGQIRMEKILEIHSKRIDKIKLSKFSEEIFINTMMTYSFAPKNKLSDE